MAIKVHANHDNSLLLIFSLFWFCSCLYIGRHARARGDNQNTKATEPKPNVSSGEYQLVRGRGTTEDTEIDFSNPLYAETEREVANESLSSVRFPNMP